MTRLLSKVRVLYRSNLQDKWQLFMGISTTICH